MKLRLTHLAFVVLVLGIAAGVYIAFFAYPKLQRERAEMDAVEAVIRHHYTGGGRLIIRREELFLRILGKDPPEELLTRMKDLDSFLHKFSKSEGGDRIFAIDSIIWKDDQHIVVRGTLGRELLGDENVKFQMGIEYKDGKWEVVSESSEGSSSVPRTTRAASGER